MASKYVICAYDPPDASFLTLYLDDKVFRLTPNEPLEIDTDSNGRRLETAEFYAHMLVAQYGSLYGVTAVPSTKTRTGITLDVEHALELAQARLLTNRHQHIAAWAQEQLQTRVNKNLPVLPPTGFVEESIKLLNVDLEATYRIRPIGWDYKPVGTGKADPNLLSINTTAQVDVAEELAMMQAENAEIKSQLAELLAELRSGKKK